MSSEQARRTATTETLADVAEIHFEIIGVPKPKGSLRAMAKGVVKEQLSDALITWGEAVAAAVREHRPDFPITGPVRVDVLFNLPAPKKPRFEHPITYRRNDLDKLCRTVLDHLTDAGVLEDDAQVVDLVLRKRYGSPGAEVWVWRVL